MPRYQFNTQNHLRIWFSGKKDVFLNEENQLRMVRFHEKNPRANVTFLYSSKMLSDEAHEKLKIFCKRHHFTPLDFDTALLDECIDQVDKDVYQIAKKELDAYVKHEGGNLAAASDLTRLITPLLVRGTYSDFDTMIEVESLRDTKEVVAPLLLDIGSIKQTMMGFTMGESPLVNNDIIGVATKDGRIEPAAKALLQQIQIDILKTYNEGAYKTLKRLSDTELVAGSSVMVQFYKLGLFDNIFKERPDISITDFRLYLDKTTKNIFGAFRLTRTEDMEEVIKGIDEGLKEKLVSALDNMDNDDFPMDFSPQEQDLIKKAYANHLKTGLKDAVDALRCISPEQAALIDASYQQIKAVDDPDECFRLLQLPITGTRTILLKESVTTFSGPMLLLCNLLSGDASVSYRDISFDGNHLFEHFHSGQSFRLGSNIEMVQERFSKSPGTACDISWLSAGQEMMQNREEKMQHAAKTIQKAWKSHVQNIKDEPPTNPSEKGASSGKK